MQVNGESPEKQSSPIRDKIQLLENDVIKETNEESMSLSSPLKTGVTLKSKLAQPEKPKSEVKANITQQITEL
jgi:hypothetical protein